MVMPVTSAMGKQDFGRVMFVTESYLDFKAFYRKCVLREPEEMVPSLDREEMDTPPATSWPLCYATRQARSRAA